jgi:serine/threonine protein kinase
MQKSVVSSCQLSGQEIPQYHLSELIGKGNFGRVYKARSVASQQIVSIKIIDIEQGDATTQGYKILLAIC